MAQAMQCDGCPEEMATVVLNIIEDAEVKALGPSCFADFSLAYLQMTRPEMLAPAKPKRTAKTRGTATRPLADDVDGNQETAPANAG